MTHVASGTPHIHAQQSPYAGGAEASTGFWLEGLRIDDATLGEAVSDVADLALGTEATWVSTLNIAQLRAARGSQRVHDAFAAAHARYADGMPVVKLARLAGHALERVAGSDMEPLLLGRLAAGASVLYVGGSAEVNTTAVSNRQAEHPDLRIGGISPDYGYDTDPTKSARLVEAINAFHAQHRRDHPEGLGRAVVTFLCTGGPKSDVWIAEHIRGITTGGVLLPFGAAVDFAAGTRRRASQGMQDAGLEWLVRLAQEPRRLTGRYVRDAAYLAGVTARVLSARAFSRR